METAKRFRSHITLKLAVAMLLLTGWVTGSSAEQKADSITVMVSPMPVFSEVADNKVSGYSVSLATGIIEHTGMTASVESLPFARVKSRLESGGQVMGAAIARIPEREDDYYWITPVTSNPLAVYVKRTHPLANTPTPDFSELKTASVRRGDYRKTLLQEQGVTDLMEVNSWGQAIEAVLKDRVDGVLFSSIGMVMMCKDAVLNCDELVPVLPVGTTYSYIAIPRTPENASLAAKLTVAASEFKATPAFKQLTEDTLPKLRALGANASVSEGVLSFNGALDAREDDLWVLAAQVPFFSESMPNGDVTGYAAELVKAMLSQAELEKPILAAPWNRIVKESVKPNVLTFAVARTPERESLYHWLTPVSRNMHALYGKQSEKYRSIHEIPKLSRVAVLREDYRERIAREAGLDVIGFDTWTAATAALLADEVDFLFGSRAGITLACRRLIESCEDINLAAEHRVVTTYVVLSKDQTETALVERLKAAAVTVKQNPAFRTWAAAWSQQLNSANGIEHHFDEGVVQLWSKQE